MCVLPMNMINQKVFTIVYFWLALLLIASIMWITLRIFLIASLTFREIWWSFFFGVNTTNVSRKASEASNFLKRFFFFQSKMFSRSTHGDFLLWTLLMKNMNTVANVQFVELLSKKKEFDQDL